MHPGICNLWCRTTMRPARLVSNAFLYTTITWLKKKVFYLLAEFHNLKSNVQQLGPHPTNIHYEDSYRATASVLIGRHLAVFEKNSDEL